MRRALVFILLAALFLPLATPARAEEFHAGQVVVANSTMAIRKQPTVNSTVVTTVVPGDQLTILDGTPTNAAGAVWWNIQMVGNDLSGWLPSASISSFESPDNSECWTAEQRTEASGIPAWSAPPAMTIDPELSYIATLNTTKGKIIIELDAVDAPIATNNFVCLAEAGFYDGTDFHRISNDFLIQGGDPSGTGTGGPGYSVTSDPTTGDYPEGSIALANSVPNENGSQFFIAATDLTGQIPDDYPVFGQVISGQEIVDDISQGKVEVNSRGELSKPVDPVTIESIEITVQEDEVGPPLPPPGASESSTPTPVPTIAAVEPTQVPAASETLIELDAKDIAFVPTEITVDVSDGPVTIRMKNTGAALHNFSIDSLGIDVDANPGETVDIIIPAGTAPGTYDFYCNVPGHKEAGMVGKLVVTSSSASTAQAGATDCSGFSTYSADYDDAIFGAFSENPKAIVLFDNDDDSDEWIYALTPTELGYLGDLFTDVGTNLTLVRAPAFAREWHALQISAFQLFAEMLRTAEDVGIFVAAIQLNGRAETLEQETRAILAEGSGCSTFDLWARDESIMTDNGLGNESSAFRVTEITALVY